VNPGGDFLMGSEQFYPRERPVHRVALDGCWMDQHPVTAAAFRRFVRQTGYVTIAERPLDPADYPDADPALLRPGSLVFPKTTGPVDLSDYRNWWAYVPGAYWKRPAGPGSTINGRDRLPAVHVAYEDVETYASWAGKALSTEAESEFTARGGLDGSVFAWGNEHLPNGKPMANTWQGEFPCQNLQVDGFEGTSPIGRFPPNGYGLYDITGNVWEWTCDWFTAHHPDDAQHACCVPSNPRVTCRDSSYAAAGTRLAHPAQGQQRRLAPVRTKLLPALPAGGTTTADDRHVHVPPRFPVHRPSPDTTSHDLNMFGPFTRRPNQRIFETAAGVGDRNRSGRRHDRRRLDRCSRWCRERTR
jgi:formylglycine-generating enzyme required for sulfatase activity